MTTRFAFRLVFVATFVAASSGSLAQDVIPAAPIESRPASLAARKDIYDTKVDGKELVAKAIEKASKDDKRVLLVFGANWCGWCHKLHGVLTKEDRKAPTGIAKLIFNEYEAAWVDVGRNDRNQDLVKQYASKVEGLPFLVVLDAKGSVLTTQETGALEAGDHHDPAKVKAFLETWRVPPRDAEAVLAEALARAKAEAKVVFLHFGAPWCGWCHRFEAFLHRPAIEAILSADFILTKIDDERMTNGMAVEKRYRGDKAGGIPWTAFLDADGRTLVSSDGPKGNIGCPWEPAEIDWFVAMIEKVRKRITPEQLKTLESELRAYASEKR